MGNGTRGRVAVTESIAALRNHLSDIDADAYVTTDPDNITYFTRFRALLYSRPIILVLGRSQSWIIVPELEERHAEEKAAVDKVLAYGERPESRSTSGERVLRELLNRLEPRGRLAIDAQRLPVALASLLTDHGFELVAIDDDVVRMRQVKTSHELDAVRQAARLVEVGVRAALDACRPGVTELAVDAAGAAAIYEAATELEHSTVIETLVMTPSGSERSVLPHALSSTRRLERGDVVIHTRQVGVDGYRAELERTLIVGRPTSKQEHAFGAMLEAQHAAMTSVGPNAQARAIDRAARDVFARAGLSEFAIHRTGHGIGVGAHEQPHLRFDSDETLLPGAVITIEPGVYIPGLGGFRHSDTVIVGRDGTEVVTNLPRTLDALCVG